MERVSFKVAKYLKEVGYQQDYTEFYYDYNGCIQKRSNPYVNCQCVAPTYVEVWFWLWREKKHYIKVSPIGVEFCWQILLRENNEWHSLGILSKTNFYDPEAAIIAAIEYLVDNDLIK